MLDVYTDFAVREAAVPVIPGRKSDSERFAGADQTFSIEAMMGDGKALQAGTSHNLGQNFAKAFEIRYLDKGGVLQHCWTTSWGLSTRFIGAIIMVHGDDQGLILPPRLAPYQLVIVPICKTDEEKASVLETARRLHKELVAAGIRVKMDEREGMSPGFKFNDWEMRGVPLRLELGPKDVAKGTVVLARRDRPGKEGKAFVPQEGIAASWRSCSRRFSRRSSIARSHFARRIRRSLRTTASSSRRSRRASRFRWWCGGAAARKRSRKRPRPRCGAFPLEQPGGVGKCIYCGEPAKEKAIFAKAY